MSINERIKAIFHKKNKRHREEALYEDIPEREVSVDEETEPEDDGDEEAADLDENDLKEIEKEENSDDAGEEDNEESDPEDDEEEWDPAEEDFDFDMDDPALKEWVLQEIEKEAKTEEMPEETQEEEETEDEPEDPKEDTDGIEEETQEEPPTQKTEYTIQNANEQIIFDLLAHPSKTAEDVQGGNELYDAVAFACRKNKIDIVPFPGTQRAQKDSEEPGEQGYTSIREIAADSHFILRKIRLNRNWHKRNGGVMVGFLKEDLRPVALYYGRLGRYVFYDPREQTCKRVNAKLSRTFSRKAYTLYAAFPNRKMTWKEMLMFGLGRTKVTDRIRYPVFTAVTVLAGLLIPLFQKALFDRLIPMSSYDEIRQTAYMVLAFLTGNVFFSISRKLSGFRAAFQMKTALYAAVCERIFHMPDKILRRYKTTELADCVLETDRLLKTVGRGWNASFVALLSMVYIVQMYSLSPMLTGQALVFTLLLLVILVLVAGKTAKREKQTILLYEEAKSRRDECFSGLEKVKSFGMQERILHHCLTAYAKEQKSRMASDRARKRIELIAKGAGSIASAFLYWCMIARHETFQTGWFIAFMASFGIFLSAMTEFGTSMAEFMVLKSLFNRVRPILETAGEYTGGSKAADIPEEDMETTEGLNGELEVSELDFAYEEEDPLFEKFSLHVNAGEFIGITGISGSGKTTLMKLLLGMEKPDRGKIYYGTSDLEQMDLWELRKKCAIVLQNDRLIEGSIRDNLCLSGRKVSEEEMLSMTDRLRLTGEIEELPDGFDTKIREDGKVLNATQRQKILIARALLKQPSMIFFDEATMDLDDESQDLVLEYLRRFKGTRFVISNRISAIAHCDRILVMNRGKVAESGNYRSLMKKKGAFYKTAIRQMV